MSFEIHFFSRMLLLLSGLSCAPAALAAENRISFDFASKSVQVRGVYTPTAQGKKSGLDAELLAREEAKSVLDAYLKKSCAAEDPAVALVPKWQKELRSQGSEIFANGVLKILLTIPLDKIFASYAGAKPVALKTPAGEAVAFKIGAPGEDHVTCGQIKVSVSPRRTVSAMPVPGTGVKVIKLVAKEGGVFQTPDAADLDLMQKLEWPAEGSEEKIALPIVRN